MKWTELRVVDIDGLDQGSLDEVVANPETRWMLDHATIVNGQIESWDYFWMCAPDEDLDHNTPRCDVDWSGFDEIVR